MKEKETPQKMTFEQVLRIIDERLENMPDDRQDDHCGTSPASGRKQSGFLNCLNRLFKSKRR